MADSPVKIFGLWGYFEKTHYQNHYLDETLFKLNLL